MHKKLLVLVIILASCASNSHAQDKDGRTLNSGDFFKLQKELYDEASQDMDSSGVEEDGPDEIYQRWAYWMMPRLYPSGKRMNPDAVYREWENYSSKHYTKPVMNKTSIWKYAGPPGAPAAGGGTGRLNVLSIKSGDPKTILAGSPDGGLWKTTDAGSNWTSLTDSIPNIGVADIAVDPTNPDNIFLATGDGYVSATVYGPFYGGNYTDGLIKSTDGGKTFQKTKLSFKQTRMHQIYRIAIYPGNPALMFACSDTGLWRSSDSGNNWTRVLSDYCVDIKFNPSDPSVMYASGTDFFYSKDSGKTWTDNSASFAGSGYSVLLLGVTPASSNIVYSLAVNYSEGFVYVSHNRGKTWSYVNKVAWTNFYGKYASAITVSPVDSNHLLLGGVDIVESRNGGISYALINTKDDFTLSSYVHPDHRFLQFAPGSDDSVYDCNDGGAYVGVSQGSGNFYKWSLISSGIHTLQLYGVATAASQPSEYFSGAQDNGINRNDGSSWKHVLGGDGMICAVKPDNAKVIFANNQYGALNKSSDGGNSWAYRVGPSKFTNYNWVTPLVNDPNNFKTLYYGGDDLYKSTNDASSWKGMKVPTNDPNNIGKIAIARSSSNYIYVVKQNDFSLNYVSMFMTPDGGAHWHDISSGLPSDPTYISDVEVDKKDSQKVWVSISGFSDGQKVYMSKDAGVNWTNMSGSLPNLPATSLAIENSDQNGVYVGTEIGVFYRNDSSSDWIRYSDGLPNVIVTEMEVIPTLNKLRVSTFGRGIWEAEVAGTISAVERQAAIEGDISIYPNPSEGQFNISLPDIKKGSPVITVYNMLGAKVYENTNLKNETNISVNLGDLPEGIYTVSFDYKDIKAYKKILISK